MTDLALALSTSIIGAFGLTMIATRVWTFAKAIIS